METVTNVQNLDAYMLNWVFDKDKDCTTQVYQEADKTQW